MPNFVKSGKYYYKVNEKSGKKTRISKDEYMKYSKSRKRIVRTAKKSIVLHKKSPVKKHVHKVTNVRSSNSLEEINISGSFKDKVWKMVSSHCLCNKRKKTKIIQ